jgi:ketosteroid isomerase-like protein
MSRTPLEVLDSRRRLVVDRDLDGFADLFATDGVLELPFAPPPMPRRLEGRESIRAFSIAGAKPPMEIEDLETVEVYETSDPEVVIVELATLGTVTATGLPFRLTSLQVFRIRDGEILLFRDYWSPEAIAELLGPT